jgi:hypothetical protein
LAKESSVLGRYPSTCEAAHLMCQFNAPSTPRTFENRRFDNSIRSGKKEGNSRADGGSSPAPMAANALWFLTSRSAVVPRLLASLWTNPDVSTAKKSMRELRHHIVCTRCRKSRRSMNCLVCLFRSYGGTGKGPYLLLGASQLGAALDSCHQSTCRHPVAQPVAGTAGSNTLCPPARRPGGYQKAEFIFAILDGDAYTDATQAAGSKVGRRRAFCVKAGGRDR